MKKVTPVLRFLLFICLVLTPFSLILSSKTIAEPSSKSLQTFTNFYDFLNQYQSANMTYKPVILTDYMDWQNDSGGGFPAIINATHVVFIYYNATQTINSCKVSLEIFATNRWKEHTMIKLNNNTSFFYLGFTLKPSTRSNYVFLVDEEVTADPRNPYRIKANFECAEKPIISELALPPFEREYHYRYRSNVPQGSLSPLSSFSSNPYVQIYLPPNYNTSHEYPVVYFPDGSLYTLLINITTILDNLIYDQKIVPLIAVFSDPINFDPTNPCGYDWGMRGEYYKKKAPYLRYLDELVEYIDNNYSTIDSPYARLHVGLSLTGYLSAIVGLERSNTFKNIAIQSMAFWLTTPPHGEAISTTYADVDPSVALNFWICVGTYENHSDVIGHTNRTKDTEELAAFFRNKTWNVSLHYHPEGHSFSFWQHTMDELLMYFFAEAPEVPRSRTTNSPMIFSSIFILILLSWYKRRK